MEIAILTLVAYLFGALPFGLFVAKSRGIDIRQQGSGNIGATNVFRCVGKGWGIFTFTLDVLKGFISAFFFPKLLEVDPEWGVLFGLAAIIGHTFPVYLKFKGGKGVATSAGMLLGVAPMVVGIGLLAWGICMVVWRYVSLASMVAAVVIAGVVWVVDKGWIVNSALTALGVMVIWLHRANIKRLLNGTESRIGKKKEDNV